MLVTINDLQARATTEAELDNTIKLLVSANIGSWGWDKWGNNGYYIKYAEFWDAKATFDITTETTINLPFRVVDNIVTIYTITGTVATPSVYYIYNDNVINVSGYAGKKIVIILSSIKNVRN